MHTSVETKTAEDDIPSRHSTMYGGNGISKQGGEGEFPVETNGECIKSSGVAPHSQCAQDELQTKDHNVRPQRTSRKWENCFII